MEDDQYIRYNNFVVTLLPEGKIWFYLDGPGRWVRLDFAAQAEEIQMELSDLHMGWFVGDTKYTGHFHFNEEDVINNFREAFGQNHNPNIRGEFVIAKIK